MRTWRFLHARMEDRDGTTHPNGLIYVALRDTMPEWQAAYERRPASRYEDAVARLAAWLDRPPGV
jgi:hypothetical protein